MVTFGHVTKMAVTPFDPSQKPHVACKRHSSIFYRTPVYCPSKFYIAGIGIFALFWSCDLDLDQWPSYMNLSRVPWRCTCRPKLTF